jgi:hypothetical protein
MTGWSIGIVSWRSIASFIRRPTVPIEIVLYP